MTITERTRALRAAGAQRSRQRLLAAINSDAPAKVRRPTLGRMPKAVAERPESSPYEKFGGVR